MSGWINDFHFLRPWCLLLLIVPLLGYRSFFAGLKNTSAWEAVCDKKLLDFLLIKGSSRQRGFIGYMALIGVIGAILALAGPSWQKKNMPAFTPANPVMLLLNLSSDMDSRDITPDRLSRAKFAINDLLGGINAQVGLIVYSDEPYLISPITDDRQIITNLLPAIGRDIVPTNGDKPGRAVDLAVERLKQGDYPHGSIVIFTADAGQEFNAALEACAAASAAGYQVNVVGVRADDNEKLQMLADKGKGLSVRVSGGLSRLAAEINNRMSSELKKTENEREIWEDGGYYLLILPLLCCLYFFRRGILILLVWLALSTEAHAGFFTNADQDGARSFAEGDYAAAADSFKHPNWKAAALYRQGNYDEALKYYNRGNDAEALYNQGNALAKSGKIEDAVKKYEEVLELNPEHEDAKFNLEYLKQQQQQQEQQSSQNQDKSENNKDENDSPSAQQQQSGNNSDSADDNTEDNQQGDEQSDNQNNNDGNSNEEGAPLPQKSNGGGEGDRRPEDGSQMPQTQNGGGDGQSEDSAESTVPSGSEPDEQSDEEAEAVGGRTQDDKGEFDEESQAREMAYRNIPEDAGGLLRAFIRKEYNKNRYGDR